ncbi:uncharacterized protein GJ701_008397 isoform 1-T1 [Geothlypis trichas]
MENRILATIDQFSSSDIEEKPCNYPTVLAPLGSLSWITGRWVDKHTELIAELLKLDASFEAMWLNPRAILHPWTRDIPMNLHPLPGTIFGVEWQLPGSCTYKTFEFPVGSESS